MCVRNRLRGGSTRGLQLSKPRDRGATGLWGEQTQRLPLVIMNEAALDRRGGGGRAAQDDDLKGIVAGWYPTCHSRARRGTEEEHGLILVGVGLRGPGFVEPRLEASTSGANKAADWQSFEAGRRRLGWQRERGTSQSISMGGGGCTGSVLLHIIKSCSACRPVDAGTSAWQSQRCAPIYWALYAHPRLTAQGPLWAGSASRSLLKVKLIFSCCGAGVWSRTA